MDPEQRVFRENNPLDHALDLVIRQRDEARKEREALAAENARLREDVESLKIANNFLTSRWMEKRLSEPRHGD